MAFAHSPKIVTDGLVLALDAGNPKSYASGSTIWRDKSGNGNDGTLTNGPTFSSGNGGSIVFDGSNDSVTVTGYDYLTVNGTFSVWYKTSSTDREALYGTVGTDDIRLVVNYQPGTAGSITGSIGVNIDYGVLSPYAAVGDAIYDGNWHNIAVSWVGSNPSAVIYFDGESKTTSYTHQSTFSGKSISNFNLGKEQSGNILNGNIAIAKIYNRALSTSEIQQNYNALKGRFGL